MTRAGTILTIAMIVAAFATNRVSHSVSNETTNLAWLQESQASTESLRLKPSKLKPQKLTQEISSLMQQTKVAVVESLFPK